MRQLKINMHNVIFDDTDFDNNIITDQGMDFSYGYIACLIRNFKGLLFTTIVAEKTITVIVSQDVLNLLTERLNKIGN